MDVKTPDLLQNLPDLLLDAVFMVDAHGKIVYVSAACERILGYQPEEMIGKAMMDFISPEDRARTWEEAMRVISGFPRIGFENRYIRKDGSLASLMWSAHWSEAHQLRIGVARDVSERKRADMLRMATHAISEAAHATDDIVELFREIRQIIGRLVPMASFVMAMRDEHTDRLHFPYQLDSHVDDSLPAQEEAVRALCSSVIDSRQAVLLSKQSPDSVPGISLLSDADASWLAIPLASQKRVLGALVVKSHRNASYTEKDKELLQFVSTQVALAVERRQLYAELLRMAQYDELTGLPNRRLFHDRAEVALAGSRRGYGRVGLLYIDIDNFKQINDDLGHAVGDLLLQEMARRLKRCVREVDTVTRLGGDEFAVLLERIQSPGDAGIVVAKIRTVLGQPANMEGRLLKMSPSIGTALYPDHGSEVGQLLRHADQAMYLEKKGKLQAPQ